MAPNISNNPLSRLPCDLYPDDDGNGEGRPERGVDEVRPTDVKAVLREHHAQLLAQLKLWVAREERILERRLGVTDGGTQARWDDHPTVGAAEVMLRGSGGPGSVAEAASPSSGYQEPSRVSEALTLAEAASVTLSSPTTSIGLPSVTDVPMPRGAQGQRGSRVSFCLQEDGALEFAATQEEEEKADRKTKSVFHRLVSTDSEERKRMSRVSTKDLTLQQMLTENNNAQAASEEPHLNSCRFLAHKLVHSVFFEGGIALVIMINAVAIGFEVNFYATSNAEPFQFTILQYCFTVIFSFELCLRMFVFRFRFFWTTQWFWNYFDLCLVLIAVIEVLMDIIQSATGAQSHLSLATARIARILRILRLVRIVRVTRIVRFVKGLRLLLHSIVATLRSVIWAMLLLAIVLYMFGVVFTKVASDYLHENTDSAQSVRMRRFFGSVPEAMLTLFQAVTGGVNWADVMDPLQEVNPFCALLLLFYLVFTIFAVLNVVTGAFCQAAIEGKQYDRELTINQLLTNKRSELYQVTDLFNNLFRNLDTDASGTITAEEFERHLYDDAVQALFALLDLSSSDALTLFNLLDVDESEDMDAEEFVMGCLRLKGPARSLDLAVLEHDNRKMGKKIMTELKHMRLGLNLLNQQQQALSGHQRS